MIWILLFFLLLVIVGVIGVIVSGKRYAELLTKENSKDAEYFRPVRTGFRIYTAIVGGLFVLLLLLTCVKVVPETEAGVPVSFGKVGGTLDSGLNVVAPWTKVATFPTRPVTVEMSGQEAVHARTADSGQVTAEIAVRWKVDRQKAPDLYRQVRTGDDDKISDTVVEKNARQAAGEVYTTLTNLQATSGDRAAAAEAIKVKLQEQVEPYGIIIEDVNLRSVEPDQNTAQVLAQLAQQKQLTEIAKEEGRTASEKANVQQIQAQAQKDASEILSQIPESALQAQCLTIIREAVQAKVPIYVNPCGGPSAGVGILANP